MKLLICKRKEEHDENNTAARAPHCLESARKCSVQSCEFAIGKINCSEKWRLHRASNVFLICPVESIQVQLFLGTESEQ